MNKLENKIQSEELFQNNILFTEITKFKSKYRQKIFVKIINFYNENYLSDKKELFLPEIKVVLDNKDSFFKNAKLKKQENCDIFASLLEAEQEQNTNSQDLANTIIEKATKIYKKIEIEHLINTYISSNKLDKNKYDLLKYEVEYNHIINKVPFINIENVKTFCSITRQYIKNQIELDELKLNFINDSQYIENKNILNDLNEVNQDIMQYHINQQQLEIQKLQQKNKNMEKLCI